VETASSILGKRKKELPLYVNQITLFSTFESLAQMKCENPDLGAKPFDLVGATPADPLLESLLKK
jgi:hypothetical protein